MLLTAQANPAADNAPGGFDNAAKVRKLVEDARRLETRAAALEAKGEREAARAAVRTQGQLASEAGIDMARGES